MSHTDQSINYLELASSDLQVTVAFFREVFAWQFTWYGDDYVAFSNAGIDGGFYRAPLSSKSSQGGALIVFYAKDLEKVLLKVQGAGAVIVKEIFSFPGGRRFHFEEPCGNEFAVWSE